jgi:hypothetical protein
LGALSAVLIAGPPQTAAAALSLCDSTQWNAEKGAYLPMALQSTDLPFNANTFTSPLYYINQPSDAYVSAPMANISYGISYPTPKIWTEFSMSGAILTGLSPQTVITINWNVIYEIAAAGQSTLLENIATPSPPLDFRALELLAALHNELPVAVEVDRNGLGDWISSAAKSISNAMTPSLSMMAPMLAMSPHPATRALGAIYSTQHLSRRQLPQYAQQSQPRQPRHLQPLAPAQAAKNRDRVSRGDKKSYTPPSGGNAPAA